MTVHVEWLRARETRAEVIAPGDDWVSDEPDPGCYILALSNSDTTAIMGTLPELRALAARITAVVTSERQDGNPWLDEDARARHYANDTGMYCEGPCVWCDADRDREYAYFDSFEHDEEPCEACDAARESATKGSGQQDGDPF